MSETGAATEIPAVVLSSPALLFLYYRTEQILGIKAGGEALVKLNDHLEKSCGASFVENPAAYERLLTSREQIYSISKFLTVNETYFFREGVHFDLLVRILPQLTKLHRPLQICSAATSIGCEAYSIAMLLDFQIKSGLKFDFAVDAFDVNEEAIETAKNARYTPYALRKDGSDWKYILDLYLTPDGKDFVVSNNIRNKVRFFNHNIMRGLNKQYDIIFFRNSLIYFSQKSRLAVLNNLAESLFDKGLLFLGVSETSSVNRPHLVNRNMFDAFYFEKTVDEIYSERPTPKITQNIRHEVKDPKRSEIKRDTRKVKKDVFPKPAALSVDCDEVAAILQADEGLQNAKKNLAKLTGSAADLETQLPLNGAELAASVLYFLNTQDFKAADVILTNMEKNNAEAACRFLRGEYYYLLGKEIEAEKCFEDAAIKDKVFWPAFYRSASLAAKGNRTRYEYKIKKAIESIELLHNSEPGKKLPYECFMGGFSSDYFRRILEKKLASES